MGCESLGLLMSDFRGVEGWKATASEGASLVEFEDGWDFILAESGEKYANAQLDDYRDIKRKYFLNTDNLSLEADICWGDQDLVGTSGMGFWNDPFLMTGWRWPSLPVVAWFMMTGRDSNMKVGNENGSGLKAQVISAWSWSFFLRLPLLLLGLVLGRFLGRNFFLDNFSRGIGLSEKTLSQGQSGWRNFRIDWTESGVEFFVDQKSVLRHSRPLTGPLGLVIWQDNQWLKFDPRQGVRWGTSKLDGSQTMKIRNIRLKRS
jgi:hypothetical protein